MKYKLIIFDLDGTLVDAYTAIEKSFNFALSSLGYSKESFDVIKRAVGWGDKNLLAPFIDKNDLNKALLIYRRHHQKSLLKYSKVFSGAKSLLQYLKNKKIKLAIATNRPTKFTKILLKYLNLDKYFDMVLCGDKLRKMKPHPEILQKIMHKLKADKDSTLFVGDMTVDIETAKAAKIDSVAVLTGSSTKKELSALKPNKIIKHVSELKKLLLPRWKKN
ncbi:MAG: HAD family hydrolase [Candidatus Omnitrophota bacterium]